MRLDAMDAVRRAKADFTKRVHSLGKVVAKNDAKANKKIEKLTGVVRRNEAKSRSGRKLIAALEESNKAELKVSLRGAIMKGEKRANGLMKMSKKMNKATVAATKMRLSTEISRLSKETHKSLEAIALASKSARAQLKKEMLYAIRSSADVAKKDLGLAVRNAKKKMVKFLAKSARIKARSAMQRKALAASIARNSRSVSRMLRDAVATQSRAQLALHAETAKKIKRTNTRVTAYAKRMAANARKTAADLKANTAVIMGKISAERSRAKAAVRGARAADAARFGSAMKFLGKSLRKAERESNAKFGKAYRTMAKNRAHADQALATSTNGLNDALAKQAALADSRFSKTVKSLGKARAQAARQVRQLRKGFTTALYGVTAHIKDVETRVTGEISVVSGEVISLKANQMRVNRRVSAEIRRVSKLSNQRYSQARRARGKLKRLMDENKAAASAEVSALRKSTQTRLTHLRSRAARNRVEMARDLTKATKKMYERMAQMQKVNSKSNRKMNRSISASAVATRNALRRAKQLFAAKVVMVSNTVAANLKRNTRDIARLTGVVHNIKKASAADRKLIRVQTKSLEADMNKSITRAIQIGEAKAKAVEQRIASNLKGTKRFLQVELSAKCERMADNVFKIVNGKRQKIADNYLSLKAYAVSVADKVTDYVGKGKGRNLSSIGDLLTTIGAIGAVRAAKAVGLGLGGSKIPALFSGKSVKVSNAVSKINGLVNEYTQSVAQVRARWPLGLGKYLLDKLEVSMMAKGVLEVDKISGKHGNFVFVNGRSVGLSNKLTDFSTLAARMTTYEGTLAKLTAKLSTKIKSHSKKKFFAKPPEWNGQ